MRDDRAGLLPAVISVILSALITGWPLACAFAQSAPEPRTIHAIDRFPYLLWREVWAGAEVQARSWSVYSGSTVALFGDLEAPGWRMRTTGGYGQYTYRKLVGSSVGPIEQTFTGHKTFSDVLFGYHAQWDRLIVKAFAGATTEHHIIDPRDPANAVAGASYGAKAALEAWFSIDARSWAAANLSAATSNGAYKFELRTGYRISDSLKIDILDVTIGLEARIDGDDAVVAGRGGGFLSLQMGDAGLSVGAGVTGDRDLRTSPYVNASLYYRF